MIGLWGVIKGLLVKEETDRTKELSIEVSSSATTGTRTTIEAAQTANRTVSIPDATDTLVGRATTDTLSNKTLDNSNAATLQDTNLTLQDEGDNTKQVQFDASNITASTTKVFGFPDENTTLVGDDATQTLQNKTIDATSATGNNTLSADASDIVFDNSTSGMTATNAQAAIDEAEGRIDTVESDKADGAASSTDNALPRFDGTTGKTLQASNVIVDDSDNMTGVNDLTVGGNLTVNGTTTTVNSATLDVTDSNITVNDGGNDASAEGAGLTVERTGTDGSLVYEDALTAKFKLGALGSEVEVADVSSSQQLTNKDIDGGTASDTSRITIPQNTKSNLDGLTRKEATIVYANDLDKLYVDDGTDLREIGSGIGIKNYFDGGDFETNLDVVTRYDDGGSYGDGTGGSPTVLSAPALNTTTPLAGTQDLDMAKTDSDAAGEGYSFTSETIDRADYGRTMYFKAFVDATDANYTSGDLQIKAYDITNGAELTVTPVSGLDSSAGIQNTNGQVSAKFTLADNTAQVRVSFHMETDSATGSAWNIYIDDILLTPEIPFQAIADGPVGEIIASGSTTTPTNFLYCDGSPVSRTVYADLFNQIGTSFGVGDGSTTFNLPNLEGEFLRGQDNSRGADPDAGARTGGDTIGSTQSDATALPNSSFTSTGTTDNPGDHSHGIATGYANANSTTNLSSVSTRVATNTTDGAGAHTHSVSSTVNGGGDSETRPRNVAVRFYIRYKSESNLLSSNAARLQTVFAEAERSAAQSLADSGSASTVALDAVIDDDYNLVDLANDRIEFNEPGRVRITGAVQFATSGTGDRGVLLVYNDQQGGGDVEIARTFAAPTSSNDTSLEVDRTYTVVAGSTVELQALQQGSGGPLNITGKLAIKYEPDYEIFAVTELSTPRKEIKTVSSTYTATIIDDYILGDTSSGAFTINLPTAVNNAGKEFVFKYTDSGFTNALTISGNGSETIDGSNTTTLNTLGESLKIISDGSNWEVVERKTKTEWVSYTPTVSGLGAGSLDTNVGKWRRNGDTIEISAVAVKDATPGSGGSTVTWSIPSGLSMDASKMALTAGVDYSSGIFTDALAGYTGSMMANTSTDEVSPYSVPPTTGSWTGSLFTASKSVSLNVKIPIDGWNG